MRIPGIFKRLDPRRLSGGGEDRRGEQRIEGGALGVLPGQADADVDRDDGSGLSGLVRQLESELRDARNELAKLRTAEPAVAQASALVQPIEQVAAPPAAVPMAIETPVAAPTLVKQPALWFAVAGWAVALVLLFRRRSI